MAGLITLKCPTCGAKLRFEKETQVFTCEHCGNVHMLEADGAAQPVRYSLSKRGWARVGDYEIIVHEIIEDRSNDQRYIYINVEYRNPNKNKTLSCRYNQWLFFDTENYSYECSGASKALYEDKNRHFLGPERFINPGMQVRGWVAFKVTPGAVLKRLQFLTGYLTTKTVDFLVE